MLKPVVVSDASPIIGLSAIGKHGLLRDLFGELILPCAVYEEITLDPRLPGGDVALDSWWVKRVEVEAHLLDLKIFRGLGPGESEAILAAQQLDSDWVLMDERRGRTIAKRLGLKVLGTLGVLLQAKRSHLIPSLKPLLDELQNSAGFHLGEPLVSHVLRIAGEA